MGGSFLEALTERQRRRLTDLARHVDYSAGSTLANQADPVPPVLILQTGFVKALRTAQGDTPPMIVDLFGAGDVLGLEDCLIGGSSHLAYVATKPVRVLEVPQKAFRRFLHDNKHAMSAAVEALAFRLRRRAAALGFAPAKVRSRLTAFLTRLQVVYGIPGEGGVVIDVGLNHADIASAIGASAASVNSEMAKLKNEGYLTTGYKTIHVKKQLREDGPPLFPAPARARRLPQMKLGRRELSRVSAEAPAV
ncbi:Crp/Fnr family transcriptional regulator [Amycolatopsis regifaucium]|uniref:Cyclic nucleotide-binding protein n=1 Tax=Amycolatopsis regifaucium TaxID=546365 RepID=A0A154MQ61_9PSEU|nr:Crp/Fnr family transcriptional regulator [Amycolatopsis regifaucium]KZB86442.1 cyclic nucleotide-binding protein [Amycolatopsis regifaucium]OKA06368.1 cyclic nucleotide-binding protein [Amycolatopsis regifaucium]SFJ30205.1 cAMP-binding domain of CRP or a regulatory subunit of cAMP-dependent protein kinases [Amycolatopsis regifaucium]